MTEPKIGDRVRVVYEGIVTSKSEGNRWVRLAAGNQFLAPEGHMTVISPALQEPGPAEIVHTTDGSYVNLGTAEPYRWARIGTGLLSRWIDIADSVIAEPETSDDLGPEAVRDSVWDEWRRGANGRYFMSNAWSSDAFYDPDCRYGAPLHEVEAAWGPLIVLEH